MDRRTRLAGCLLAAALAVGGCAGAPTAGSATPATTLPAATRPAGGLTPDQVAPAVQRAVAEVTSVRTTGTVSYDTTVAPIEIVTLYEDSFVTAREAYYGDGDGGTFGFLGVDGRTYTRTLAGPADRGTEPWQPVDDDADPDERLSAASTVNLDGRMEVVSYLLGARDPELRGIEPEGGSDTAHYRANAAADDVIEYSVPGEVPFWEYARDQGYDSWDVEVWLPADLRPVRMRLTGLAADGTELSVVDESYTYDSPGDAVADPPR